MILRLSGKLKAKIKTARLAELPLDDNPLADWSGHLFTAARTQYIILSNTPSLYSCVMHARGITNDSRFIHRAQSTICEFMEDDRLGDIYQRKIEPAGGTVTFATALNRSVTGSMNELIMSAERHLVEGDLSPHLVGFKLNDILLSALRNAEGRKYAKPRDVFSRLAG